MGDLDYQIEQCKLLVSRKRTGDFYSELPHIKDNCQCGDCAYFEDVVIKKNLRLFEILTRFGVTLSRQPNVNPDGVSSVGDTVGFKRSYFGYYIVFGKIMNHQDQPFSFVFDEEDSSTGFTIEQMDNERLTFDFFIEVERNN